MHSLLISLPLSLFIYLCIGLLFFGWGFATFRLFKIGINNQKSITITVWIGWAVMIFILQIVYLFLPLNAFVVIPLFLTGIILGIKFIAKRLRSIGPKQVLSPNTLLIGIPFLLITIWIALHAMLQPTNYDSGLYHFNAIRWINSYPLVVGLGNLHGRFAFNQTFFLYAAALNFFPWFGQGRSIANSFLYLLTLATFLKFLAPAIKKPFLLIQSHPFRYLPSLFLIPYMGYLAITSNGIASPTPDLASILLQMVIFIILVRGIADWQEGKSDLNQEIFYLSTLTAVLVTIKLSNSVFGLVVFLFITFYLWRISKEPKRSSKPLIYFLFPILLISVWCISGYLLSGVPLYPSTFGYIPFDWAIPREWIQGMSAWIYSWARTPDQYPDQVLGNWNWLLPWLTRISAEKIDFIYPLITSIITLIIAGLTDFASKRKRIKVLNWCILLLTTGALIYWFLTAPDIRFLNATLPLILVSALIILYLSTQRIINKKWGFIILVILFLTGNWFYINYAFQNIRAFRKVSLAGYYDPSVVELVKKKTKSGLEMYVPLASDQCWDSPIPCTPYFHPDLKLRNPGEIKSGFELEGIPK